eukprot:TRINITY_DN20512_c0_g1_i1.p1 TRINITY_DN20512_c0_g1~~TRINITY_DN20512_c0_g1_i1.p1  ORF type:complete len:189 (+),score=7.39 TRINITY_DN20512_c0_g1_i1:155-721(+)
MTQNNYGGCCQHTEQAWEEQEKGSKQQTAKKSSVGEYYPILLLFAITMFFTLFTASYPLQLYKLCGVFMAIWLSALAFLKLLAPQQFAQVFSLYHPVAKVWTGFGYAFPFVELVFAALMARSVNHGCHFSVTVAICVIYLLDAGGVAYALYQGRSLKCACMGAVQLPLTWLTVTEDLMMIGHVMGHGV